MQNKEIIFEDLRNPLLLFGENDNKIRFIEKEFLVSIFPKGNRVFIEGKKDNIFMAEKVLNILFHESQKGHNIFGNDLEIMVHQVKKDERFCPGSLDNNQIFIHRSAKVIKPKTSNQADYLKAIKENDLVFGIGPAGTGKTYLSVALGVLALLEDRIQRLILTRPIVEAGENLGFLPGDLEQKINPYLRPLFDAIYDILPYEDFIKFREKDRIEVAPLAYMRGRTLDNSFIILDEAQNTTVLQMKMFLTRLGPHSKTVVTGDLTQIDIAKKNNSGLLIANKILKSIDGISIIHFNNSDIIRHPLVKEIIKAFDKK